MYKYKSIWIKFSLLFRNKLGNKFCLPLIKEDNICIIRDNEEESNGSFGNCYKGLVVLLMI